MKNNVDDWKIESIVRQFKILARLKIKSTTMLKFQTIFIEGIVVRFSTKVKAI